MKKDLVFYGKVSFQVLRLSNNIPLALPYVLFGTHDLNGSYAGFLQIGNNKIVGVNNDNGIINPTNLPYVPGHELVLDNVIVNPFGAASPGWVQFSYRQLTSGLIDFIYLNFISSMPYMTFLQSLQTRKLHFKKVINIVSDVTLIGQLDQPLLFGTIGSIGLKGQTSFTPSTFQDPNNSSTNVIKMEFDNQELTKEYGMVGFLQQDLFTNYSLNFTFDIYEEEKK